LRKARTLVPPYKTRLLCNHRVNSHPSSQPLSRFASLVADDFDENYDEAWKTFVREKQYIDAREMSTKRQSSEIRERIAEIERREEAIKQRELSLNLVETKIKIDRKGFDQKLLSLLSSYGSKDVAEEVKGLKRRRDEVAEGNHFPKTPKLMHSQSAAAVTPAVPSAPAEGGVPPGRT